MVQITLFFRSQCGEASRHMTLLAHCSTGWNKKQQNMENAVRILNWFTYYEMMNIL